MAPSRGNQLQSGVLVSCFQLVGGGAGGEGLGPRDAGIRLFPAFGVGLLDFEFSSSPRPAYSSPNPSWSGQPECPPGVPHPRLSLECLQPPTPECPWSAHPRFVPGVPNPRMSLSPRVLLQCPTPKCPCSAQPQSAPRSAQPQSVPGVPNPRVSLPREGGDVRSKII